MAPPPPALNRTYDRLTFTLIRAISFYNRRQRNQLSELKDCTSGAHGSDALIFSNMDIVFFLLFLVFIWYFDLYDGKRMRWRKIESRKDVYGYVLTLASFFLGAAWLLFS